MVATGASHSQLSTIVVCLGGFHLLMPFIGSVGYIMCGNGFKDMWSLINAADSIDKMSIGHTYARALCAYYLTQTTLAVIFMNEIEMNEASHEQLHETTIMAQNF